MKLEYLVCYSVLLLVNFFVDFFSLHIPPTLLWPAVAFESLSIIALSKSRLEYHSKVDSKIVKCIKTSK